MGSAGVSFLFFFKYTVRDFIYGSIAGAITGGASAFFTSNIVYAMVVGFSGGTIQVLIHQLF